MKSAARLVTYLTMMAFGISTWFHTLYSFINRAKSWLAIQWLPWLGRVCVKRFKWIQPFQCSVLLSKNIPKMFQIQRSSNCMHGFWVFLIPNTKHLLFDYFVWSLNFRPAMSKNRFFTAFSLISGRNYWHNCPKPWMHYVEVSDQMQSKNKVKLSTWWVFVLIFRRSSLYTFP